jgi:hypothetical protein
MNLLCRFAFNASSCGEYVKFLLGNNEDTPIAQEQVIRVGRTLGNAVPTDPISLSFINKIRYLIDQKIERSQYIRHSDNLVYPV